MFRAAALSLLSVVTGCVAIFGVDDYGPGRAPESQAGGGGGATGGDMGGGGAAGRGGRGGGGQGGEGGTGGAPSGLDDGNLFARYWIDDAAAGQMVTSIDDAGPNPAPLAIAQLDGSLQWIEDTAGQRALSWTNVEPGDVALVPADTTKYAQLYGRMQLTVEAVLLHRPVSYPYGRLFQLGDDSPWSALGLVWVSPGGLQLAFSDNGYFIWVVPSDKRVVIHLLLDTPASPDVRARFYIDGALAPPAQGSPPPQDSSIQPQSDAQPDTFSLGNREDMNASWSGAIHYLAVYTTVFDEQRVAAHAAILSARDDAP